MVLNDFCEDIKETVFQNQLRYIQIEQNINMRLIKNQYDYVLNEDTTVLNEGIFKAIIDAIKSILGAIRDFFRTLFGRSGSKGGGGGGGVAAETKETKKKIEDHVKSVEELQRNIEDNKELEEKLKQNNVKVYIFDKLKPSGSSNVELFPKDTYSNIFLKNTDKVLDKKNSKLKITDDEKLNSYNKVMKNICEICGFDEDLSSVLKTGEYNEPSVYYNEIKKRCLKIQNRKFSSVNNFKNYMLSLKKMSNVLDEEVFENVRVDLNKNSDLIDKKIKDINRSVNDDKKLKEYLSILTECQKEFNKGYALYFHLYTDILKAFKESVKVCDKLINGPSGSNDDK